MWKLVENIDRNTLYQHGFKRHSESSSGIPHCDWYKFINNSRLVCVDNDFVKQYTVKSIGKKEYFTCECSETKFIASKVKDLIDAGIIEDIKEG